MTKAKRAPQAKEKLKKESDDFVSVARRIGCDEDKATFEAKLAKIAKHRPAEKQGHTVKPRR